ncbi:hypothetical protein EB796_003135 [Bugula neritina]|uniref:Uncharacterized protein n=1 Tax=Bugula neritina TaxID=10212 RepID=A0A7J7KLA7_BUGNE|nr:hypothetical protein EB796_003135 [Bugula neritina]
MLLQSTSVRVPAHTRAPVQIRFSLTLSILMQILGAVMLLLAISYTSPVGTEAPASYGAPSAYVSSPEDNVMSGYTDSYGANHIWPDACLWFDWPANLLGLFFGNELTACVVCCLRRSDLPAAYVAQSASLQPVSYFTSVSTADMPNLSDGTLKDMVYNMSGVHISGTESYSTEPQQQLANVGGGNAQSGVMSSDVSQYPSPDDTLQNESSSPTFYLPDPSEPPEPTSDGSNLGQFWCRVHTMTDPSCRNQTEVISSSLANDLEEVTMSHAQQLMNGYTKKVLDTQSNITYDDIRDTIDDDAVQHWSNCGKLVEMQALKTFRRLRDDLKSREDAEKIRVNYDDSTATDFLDANHFEDFSSLMEVCQNQITQDAPVCTLLLFIKL